jgi:hypothetical protein
LTQTALPLARNSALLSVAAVSVVELLFPHPAAQMAATSPHTSNGPAVILGIDSLLRALQDATTLTGEPEILIVVQAVAGSNPVVHPRREQLDR